MAQGTESIPGVSDILPDEAAAWRLLEDAARDVFGRYGFGELRTPIFERTEVFLKSIGDESDIVQKEMYTFDDRGGRSLTLRPEGTAGVMRALANVGIGQGEEQRVYYFGPMFRGERPAAGRKRQFHQVGVENVGKSGPAFDVECIAMLMDYLKAIEVDQVRLLLNTRGTADDRARIGEQLKTYFSTRLDGMCDDCKRRVNTNVWRMLDCKVPTCRPTIDAAPIMTELMSDATKAYFATVCAGLDALGIVYELDPRLVRGLDYYGHTVFEVVFAGIGAQNSLAGGGRYEIVPPGAKKALEGVGFACGMERLLLAREELGRKTPPTPPCQVYLVGLGAAAQAYNLKLAHDLRTVGVRVLMDLEGRAMKAQMRSADKAKATHALILGETELAAGKVVCKTLATGEQQEFPLDQAVQRVVDAVAAVAATGGAPTENVAVAHPGH